MKNNKKFLNMLKHFDEPNAYERPAVPFANLSEDLTRLQKDLEDFMNSKLTLITAQDAAFLGYISLSSNIDSPFSLRISNFGKLITIVGKFDRNSSMPIEKINIDVDMEKIVNIINTNGFTYIPLNVLLLEYSGNINLEKIIQKKPKWWNRYFDYL